MRAISKLINFHKRQISLSISFKFEKYTHHKFFNLISVVWRSQTNKSQTLACSKVKTHTLKHSPLSALKHSPLRSQSLNCSLLSSLNGKPTPLFSPNRSLLFSLNHSVVSIAHSSLWFLHLLSLLSSVLYIDLGHSLQSPATHERPFCQTLSKTAEFGVQNVDDLMNSAAHYDLDSIW